MNAKSRGGLEQASMGALGARVISSPQQQPAQGNKGNNNGGSGGGSILSADYPERLGQPECQYFMKTGTCKFGPTCKYHHPKDKTGSPGRPILSPQGLPIRPSEKECAYYMRTGTCKYGVTCKFHHPLQAAVPSPTISAAGFHGALSGASQAGAGLTGLPWPGFLPPRMPGAGFPVVLPPRGMLPLQPTWPHTYAPIGIQQGDGQPTQLGTSILYASPGQSEQFPSFIPSASMTATSMGMPAQQGQLTLSAGPLLNSHSSSSGKDTVFPERLGTPECQYYMKTGDCKFGMTCRYHHPKNRSMPSPTCVLSAMGLPLRPGMQSCAFYTRYGICKFGPTCKFDHPIMTELSYSPSASSLVDLPVAPYPIPFSHSPAAARMDVVVMSAGETRLNQSSASQTTASTTLTTSSSSQPLCRCRVVAWKLDRRHLIAVACRVMEVSIGSSTPSLTSAEEGGGPSKATFSQPVSK